MYLVEPESGQRCHYQTARALGAAIRRGELTPRAKIFHQTSSQWLPITVHPEYRRAEADWDHRSVRRLSMRAWTFLPDASHRDDPVPSGAADEQGLMLIPGDGEPSWLGTAFRHLLHLARPGA
jgi:hypothetical protein